MFFIVKNLGEVLNPEQGHERGLPYETFLRIPFLRFEMVKF